MSSYYNTLNVANNATSLEIKQAYFRLVRKHPPDKNPKEFMKIREAYEVLIDEKTRRQYDLVGSMPEIVRHCFDEGQRALSEGSAEEAIHLLEQIIAIYPDFAIINSLLGDAYLENGNSGKAIGIFEELAVQEQNNAGFIGKLAYAYLMRGWHKKAVAKFRQALSLDEDNISLWLGLIDCYLKADNLKKAQATAYEKTSGRNEK